MAQDGELILLIEDEPQMRRFLRVTLQSYRYRLLEAAAGEEGLALAATRSPDVILLDLGLPDLDGLEVTRRLREWSAVPIIVHLAGGKAHEPALVGEMSGGVSVVADVELPFVPTIQNAIPQAFVDSDHVRVGSRVPRDHPTYLGLEFGQPTQHRQLDE